MSMSSIHVVLCQLEKDYKAIHELWVDAKNRGDIQMAEELLSDLIEMNDIYMTMFGDDVRRHIRRLSNDEF